MWARVLFLLGALLSLIADLDAGGQKIWSSRNSNCELPPEKGPGNKLELRWFYNSKSRRCERFFYGGCNGNANNFKDINECDRCCVDPDNRGYCPLMIPPPTNKDLCFKSCTRDKECSNGVSASGQKCCPFGDTKICVEAVEEHPGVCPKRVEEFTFAPCNQTCAGDHDCPLTEKCCFTGCSRGCLPSVRNDRCQLPRDHGSCSNELQRFYYEPEEKRCHPFVYRGCEGNSNNFETMELCERTCGEVSKGTEETCRTKVPGMRFAGSQQIQVIVQHIQNSFTTTGTPGSVKRFLTDHVVATAIASPQNWSARWSVMDSDKCHPLGPESLLRLQ
ncbi:tissue factor pathway inhibitor 2-like [Erythrolamprus reginae]|uniref:tissue factor pathway inhibitor 2-like n=1 Tax=Erythrolamprus reginae TaxID=121349 RepID=UPI00396C894F